MVLKTMFVCATLVILGIIYFIYRSRISKKNKNNAQENQMTDNLLLEKSIS